MRIDSITLNNFGSYEGETIFETKAVDDRNIILIGGKNGAGKTTLFTAMRICLYGYLSMGYKNFNSFYIKAITKLINNNAKLSKPALASVSMEIELNNGQGMDIYTLSKILGHSSVTVTEQAYLDINDDDMSKRYQTYSPLNGV